jgi:hypothetical protein
MFEITGVEGCARPGESKEPIGTPLVSVRDFAASAPQSDDITILALRHR